MNLERTRQRILIGKATLVLALGSWLALSGCAGIQTSEERDARARAEEIIQKYRPGGRATLPSLRPGGSPETFVQHAVLRHPQVEAAYYEWLASVEEITKRRSLPDPRLTFEADVSKMISALMPGLMMDLPGPGKLRAAADVASAEARMKYFAFEAAMLKAAFGFKKAWLDLRLVDERIRVNEEMANLLGYLEELAQARSGVGKASLQDALRARMEREKLLTELENLRDSRQPYLAQFKASLGLGADDPSPPLPRELPTTSSGLSGEAVLRRAMDRNPQLKAMEADVRRAEAALVSAKRSRIPDFALGVEADVKSSPLMVRPAAGMTLPLWRDKIAAEIAAAGRLESASRARLTSERLNLTVEVAMKSFEYRENTRLLTLLEGSLLPKARQSLEIGRSSYSSGTASFIDLIDAQRTLLEFQLAEVEARVRRELALAELSLQIMGDAPALDSTSRR